MVYIYILGLLSNKYYVGKTNDPNIRLDQHFNSDASAWTQKYKPINVLELIPNCDEFDEDKYTIKMMAKYGIDNVRGGSFSQLVLPGDELKTIHKMINSSQNNCYKCGSNTHFIKNCPQEDKELLKWDLSNGANIWIKKIDDQYKPMIDENQTKRIKLKFDDECDKTIIELIKRYWTIMPYANGFGRSGGRIMIYELDLTRMPNNIIDATINDICDIFNRKKIDVKNEEFISNKFEQWCYDMALDHYKINIYDRMNGWLTYFSATGKKIITKKKPTSLLQLEEISDNWRRSGCDKIYENDIYIVWMRFDHSHYFTRNEKKELVDNIKLVLDNSSEAP